MVMVSGAVQIAVGAGETVAWVALPIAVIFAFGANGPPLTLLLTSVAVNSAVADVRLFDAAVVHDASVSTRLVVYSMTAVVAPQPVAPDAFETVPDVAPAVWMKAPPARQPPLMGRRRSAVVIVPEA